jgi:hypothetical protein
VKEFVEEVVGIRVDKMQEIMDIFTIEAAKTATKTARLRDYIAWSWSPWQLALMAVVVAVVHGGRRGWVVTGRGSIHVVL